MGESVKTNVCNSELIPSDIKYAELMNKPLIHRLCEKESALGHNALNLNEHSGALMVFREPKDSWKQLIEHCCTNEGDACCDMGNLKLNENNESDVDMNDEGKKKKKRRPIRLHTSYSHNGINQNKKNMNVNSRELKTMVNK